MNKDQPYAITRRGFLSSCAALTAAASFSRGVHAQDEPFALRYNLASSMYGELPLAEILPEVAKVGADTIDIWPKRHGNQREQWDAMGDEAFRALLDEHGVKLGMITRYDLGPYKLQDELKVAGAFGARIVVAGSGRIDGDSIKARVETFIERMKPHVAVAEEAGVTIAIENHSNALIESFDSLRYLAELSPSPNLGIALAPYHLPQEPETIAHLIRDIAPRLAHFYAWEHGHGSRDKMPKVLEMKQLPGYGPLDFAPIVAALRDIDYAGWTSVFMHPVPRGIPILPTAGEVTAAMNRSREYLDSFI
jgi:sugar phosphate isomerase/epimerase